MFKHIFFVFKEIPYYYNHIIHNNYTILQMNVLTYSWCKAPFQELVAA
jgi:hypothetical protein